MKFSLDKGHVAFMVLRLPGSVVHQQNYGFSTYSEEWIGHYIKNQYWLIDPSVVLALVRAAAFDCEAEPTLS